MSDLWDSQICFLTLFPPSQGNEKANRGKPPAGTKAPIRSFQKGQLAPAPIKLLTPLTPETTQVQIMKIIFKMFETSQINRAIQNLSIILLKEGCGGNFSPLLCVWQLLCSVLGSFTS